MSTLRQPLLAFALPFLLAACTDSVTETETGTDPDPDPDTTEVSAAAQRGRIAFAKECSGCHTAVDGFDLAYFDFADSTIIRRAIKHVDLATAQDIVAHVRSLSVSPRSRDLRLFQPGQVVLGNDVEFGRSLFGSDAFPTTLTTAQLRAIDPLDVKIAVALPRWSVEQANTDWLPDDPLPAAVLADQDSLPAHSLAAYRVSPTQDNLLRVMTALFSALHRPDSPGPCHFESSGRVDHAECFQAERWASALVAQYMIRNGITRPLPDTSFHNLWWEVGDAARRSIVRGQIENAEENRITWLYLGWMFEPEGHPTLYLMPGLSGLGLGRHAIFVGLRSMVARRAGDWHAYRDLVQVARHGETAWLYPALRFAYEHLLERVRANDLPPASRLTDASDMVSTAANEAAVRMTPAQRDTINALAAALLAALPAH